MDSRPLPDLPSNSNDDEFTEIDITSDLRAVAALHDEYYISDDDNWTEDSSMTEISPSLSLYQSDIRSYFLPLPKKAYPQKQHTGLDYRLPPRKESVDASSRYVSIVLTKALSEHSANSNARSQRLGKGGKPKEYECKDPEQNREVGDSPEPEKKSNDYPQPLSLHPSRTARNINHHAPKTSPQSRGMDVPSPSGRQPEATASQHSPSSSEGGTLVNSSLELESDLYKDMYATLPPLPIRLVKRTDGILSQDDQSQHRKDGPHSPQHAKIESAYPSSEALASEQRPSGTTTLQGWIQEHRRSTANKPPVPPKKTLKKGRPAVKPGKKPQQKSNRESTIHPGTRIDIPGRQMPADETRQPNARDRQSVFLASRRSSSETVRQGKMVVAELQRPTVLVNAPSKKGKGKKKNGKPSKLVKLFEAYSKNMEGIQMIQ